MEAPEKLYYGFNEQAHLEAYCPQKTKLCQIEYIRTDTFIEKAEKWIKENFVNDQGLYCVITDYNTVNEMIEEFRKYMKGE